MQSIEIELGSIGFQLIQKLGSQTIHYKVCKMASKQHLIMLKCQNVKRLTAYMNIQRNLTYNIQILDLIQLNQEDQYICVGWAEGGNLKSLLQEKQYFKVEEQYEIMKFLALSLQELHKNNLTHNNIKSENVLIFSEGPQLKYKLSLPSFSDQQRPDDYAKWSDIFQLGLLYVEIIAGGYQFESPNHNLGLNSKSMEQKEKEQQLIFCLSKFPKQEFWFLRFMLETDMNKQRQNFSTVVIYLQNNKDQLTKNLQKLQSINIDIQKFLPQINTQVPSFDQKQTQLDSQQNINIMNNRDQTYQKESQILQDEPRRFIQKITNLNQDPQLLELQKKVEQINNKLQSFIKNINQSYQEQLNHDNLYTFQSRSIQEELYCLDANIELLIQEYKGMQSNCVNQQNTIDELLSKKSNLYKQLQKFEEMKNAQQMSHQAVQTGIQNDNFPNEIPILKQQYKQQPQQGVIFR